jgi:hypothetical protein
MAPPREGTTGMAKRSYAFERGGPKLLHLRWRWRMRDFQVEVGGASWTLDTSSLLGGTTLILADGSSLHVRLSKPSWWSVGRRKELLVERDGVPVPGSDGHPLVIGRRAASLILFFAFLRILFILLWQIFDRSRSAPGGGLSAVFGLATITLLVLGIIAMFGRRLPVILAAGVFALETVVALAGGVRPNPLGLIILVAVVVELVRAWRRMVPRQRAPSLASVFE